MISGLISLAVCGTAAYRLRAGPLAGAGFVLAGIALVAVLLPGVFAMRGWRVPKAVTALSHVCGALGAFFVFVSFSLS